MKKTLSILICIALFSILATLLSFGQALSTYPKLTTITNGEFFPTFAPGVTNHTVAWTNIQNQVETNFEPTVTNIAQSVASSVGITNQTVWTNVVDANRVWKFFEDNNNSLMMSNPISHAFFIFFTNGAVTIQPWTNVTTQNALFQLDQTIMGASGDGVLGDDFLHINGQQAYLELGGTGSPYWASQFGFLPSWILQKDANFGSYNQQDLWLIAHNQAQPLSPFGWEFEWQTNGSANCASNFTSFGNIYASQGIQSTGSVYSLAPGGTASFCNTQPPYNNSGGGPVILTAFGAVLQIVATTGNSVTIEWSHQGGNSFNENLKSPGVVGPAWSGYQWSLQSGANSLYGLWENDDSEAGAGSNFLTLGTNTCNLGFASHAVGSLPFASTGITNTLAVNLQCIGVNGSGMWISNGTTAFKANLGNQSGIFAQSIELQPGDSLIGSGMIEVTNRPF
jgi:hypothetical protein